MNFRNVDRKLCVIQDSRFVLAIDPERKTLANAVLFCGYIDHNKGIYPAAASGNPWKAEYIGVKGDPIADLTEDLAAEQKARATYDNILRFCDDPDVRDVIKYLREREIVHFQRFGETLNRIQEKACDKCKYYTGLSNK